jgi:hypothetical protein
MPAISERYRLKRDVTGAAPSGMIDAVVPSLSFQWEYARRAWGLSQAEGLKQPAPLAFCAPIFISPLKCAAASRRSLLHPWYVLTTLNSRRLSPCKPQATSEVHTVYNHYHHWDD